MISSVLGLWKTIKSFRTVILIIGTILVVTAATVAIKTYVSGKIIAEEQRRNSEIDAAVQAALAKANVTQLKSSFEALSKQIASERQERIRVDQELQELRATTEKTVQRIQRRQSQLSKLLLDKPVETAAELSSEYNELNRSLK